MSTPMITGKRTPAEKKRSKLIHSCVVHESICEATLNNFYKQGWELLCPPVFSGNQPSRMDRAFGGKGPGEPHFLLIFKRK